MLADSEGDGGLMVVVWAGRKRKRKEEGRGRGRDGAVDGWFGASVCCAMDVSSF